MLHMRCLKYRKYFQAKTQIVGQKRVLMMNLYKNNFDCLLQAKKFVERADD